MLSKNKRLNLSKSFQWVVTGKKIETSHFKIFYKNGLNTQPLVGVAIKSGVFKEAHQRNQVKRIAFKVLESIYTRLPNQQNLVIMPKVSLDEVSVEALVSEIDGIKDLYQSN